MGKLYPIPTIDLFAGPGGLGEGFTSASAADGRPFFDIRLSIEKDLIAHRTLELRAFVRSFASSCIPGHYYDYLRGKLTRQRLFDTFPQQAERAASEAMCAELGAIKPGHAVLHARIAAALDGSSS